MVTELDSTVLSANPPPRKRTASWDAGPLHHLTRMVICSDYVTTTFGSGRHRDNDFLLSCVRRRCRLVRSWGVNINLSNFESIINQSITYSYLIENPFSLFALTLSNITSRKNMSCSSLILHRRKYCHHRHQMIPSSRSCPEYNAEV